MYKALHTKNHNCNEAQTQMGLPRHKRSNDEKCQ